MSLVVFGEEFGVMEGGFRVVEEEVGDLFVSGGGRNGGYGGDSTRDTVFAFSFCHWVGQLRPLDRGKCLLLGFTDVD